MLPHIEQKVTDLLELSLAPHLVKRKVDSLLNKRLGRVSISEYPIGNDNAYAAPINSREPVTLGYICSIQAKIWSRTSSDPLIRQQSKPLSMISAGTGRTALLSSTSSKKSALMAQRSSHSFWCCAPHFSGACCSNSAASSCS